MHWPAIIGANILKIRHPKIAHELLNAPGFWGSVGTIKLGLEGENEDKKMDEALVEHIKETCSKCGVVLDEKTQAEVKAALAKLCSNISLFMGLNEDASAYQFNIAEAPAAVRVSLS